MNETTRRFLLALPGLIAVGTLPLALLVGVFYGFTVAGIVAAVLWIGVLPITAILVEEVFDVRNWGTNEQRDEQDEQRDEDDVEDPLETLRERYARGEINDEEFERRLEVLVETDDHDPEEFLERRRRDRDGSQDRNGSPSRTRDEERDAEFEPEFDR